MIALPSGTCQDTRAHFAAPLVPIAIKIAFNPSRMAQTSMCICVALMFCFVVNSLSSVCVFLFPFLLGS